MQLGNIQEDLNLHPEKYTCEWPWLQARCSEMSRDFIYAVEEVLNRFKSKAFGGNIKALTITIK